ncbi:rod shape-determining protein MreD [Sporomusaceae bacterium FL31]|nr:rod shape-determining protein MreD [Sporomusaceae bacterium FL31]GCE32490.1 rod shape-determining protein MreD [Sporomusaceae bacterium]
MKAVFWGIIVIAALIIQATVMPLLAFQGVQPDLLLIVVVSSSLLLGKDQGVSIGFFSGLLQDLVGGNIFGLNTLSKLITGYLFGMAERKVFKEHILLPVLAMVVATFCNSAISFILLLLLGYKIELMSAIINTVIPLLMYNVIVAIPVHQVIYRVSQIK